MIYANLKFGPDQMTKSASYIFFWCRLTSVQPCYFFQRSIFKTHIQEKYCKLKNDWTKDNHKIQVARSLVNSGEQLNVISRK